MVKLSRQMIEVIIDEFGPDEFIARIADPVWFQSLGTVLAFDWNASGLTTILTAALKEAIRGQEKDLGIFICGGKGKTSRKTPLEIENWSEQINASKQGTNALIYASRMTAKVDSSLIQDGYNIYHHTFFFSKHGFWTVVQQGMNTQNSTARRYHWHDAVKNTHNFVNKPHTGIAAQLRENNVLDLTATSSDKNRSIGMELIEAGYQRVMNDIELLYKHSSELSRMIAFRAGTDKYTLLEMGHNEFEHHKVEQETHTNNRYLKKIFEKITEQKPKTYEELVAMEGVGPKTIRSLALVAEVIYGAQVSREDPARYSFAHGGKDAVPYPVDRETYDKTIEIMRNAVRKSKLSYKDKSDAMMRLH
jgi:hypothetical protein